MKCPAYSELSPPPAGKSGWPWMDDSPSPAGSAASLQADDIGINWPRITIVTPSYNQGQFLEETIRSVLLQGYPHLEYIVVDGGSTDNSVEIIRKYEKFIAWWVSEKDQGQSHALNKGFARATGSIYAYINSDDLYLPGALYTMAKALMDGQTWAVGQVEYLLDGKRAGSVPQLPGRNFIDWFVTCPVSQPGSFWSSDLHRAAGAFRENLHYFFDYEFWLRCRFTKNVFPSTVDQSIALYRIHPHSKTVRDSAGFARERKAIKVEYRLFLSRYQRAMLWLFERHHKARLHGSRAIHLARQGNMTGAAGHLKTAFMSSPLLLIDPGIFRVVKQLLLGEANEPKVPDLWREWED